MSTLYRPAGQWCDVCTLPDGRIAFVRAETVVHEGLPDESFVVCEIDGVETWRKHVPAPLLMPRCAFVPTVNSVVAIGKANDVGGPALLVWPAAVNNLGATAGNNPVAITPTNAYMVIAPDRVRVISLLNAVATEQAIPWTSQGIRDVVGTTIVLGDATYAGVVGGQNFGEYQTRGALTVGQHGNGIGVLIGSQFFVPRQGPINYNVHGAQSGSRIAVCAWTEGGSYYQEFTPPYPIVAVPPPPPPPPVPVPPPPPEPKPVPTIPQPEIDRAKAMLAQVRAEIGFGANQPDAPYITLVAQRLGGRWGLNGKRGDPNNLSHDVLAYRVDGGQPLLVDALGDGGGANTPQFGILDYPEPAGAVWVDPGGAPSQPPSVPPPNTAPDLSGALAALAARVAQLEAKPAFPTRIALKTADGHYVCAEGGGNGVVNATRTAAGSWETYTVEPQ